MTFETLLYDMIQKGRFIIIERIIDSYNSKMAKNWQKIGQKFSEKCRLFRLKKAIIFWIKIHYFSIEKVFKTPKSRPEMQKLFHLKV